MLSVRYIQIKRFLIRFMLSLRLFLLKLLKIRNVILRMLRNILNRNFLVGKSLLVGKSRWLPETINMCGERGFGWRSFFIYSSTNTSTMSMSLSPSYVAEQKYNLQNKILFEEVIVEWFGTKIVKVFVNTTAYTIFKLPVSRLYKVSMSFYGLFACYVVNYPDVL